MKISSVIRPLLFTLTTLTTVTSCGIREDLPPCPPMQIDIVVKDKNYFNAIATDGIEPVRDENLPFREYVSTLYYRLDNAETGEMVWEQTNFAVTGDDKVYSVTMPESLPFGKYTLTVWGNMQSDRPLSEDANYTEVTQNHAAENDIYVTTLNIDYNINNANFRAELERAKGKLIVMAENMPEDIDFSTKDMDGIYRYIGRGLNYAGETEFHTETEWSQPVEFSTDMLLCPSTGHEATTLDVNFYSTAEGDGQEPLQPEDIGITMSRNEVTMVRYVYQPKQDEFEIYVFVNDNWEKVHQMEIE